MQDQKNYDLQLIKEFRENRDKAGDQFAGRPLLLLTTIGAKSGQTRTKPMMYIPDGDRLLVIASNVGAPVHPAWYHNLVAHPDVTVEIGSEIYSASAVVLAGAEREQTWTRIIELYPFFVEHQAKTHRQIPIVALERQEG